MSNGVWQLKLADFVVIYHTTMSRDDPLHEQLPTELSLTPEHSNLMRAVAGSIGSLAYKNYLVTDEHGRTSDILAEGWLACAYYLSNLLTSQGLLPCPHFTVQSTVTCMEANGWEPDEERRIGNVVRWRTSAGRRHLGIVVSANVFAANSSRKGMPQLYTEYEALLFGEADYYSHPRIAADSYESTDSRLTVEDIAVEW